MRSLLCLKVFLVYSMFLFFVSKYVSYNILPLGGNYQAYKERYMMYIHPILFYLYSEKATSQLPHTKPFDYVYQILYATVSKFGFIYSF